MTNSESSHSQALKNITNICVSYSSPQMNSETNFTESLQAVCDVGFSMESRSRDPARGDRLISFSSVFA